MGGQSGGAMDGKGVRTPWGNAAELRAKRMRPGRGNAPEESERSQRERLFGAMVAISSEKGYEATKIADLVKLAGVSRAAFYEHFRDKQECLLAAVDALVEPTIAVIERAEDAPTGEARMRQAVEAFLGLVAAPAGRLEDGLHRGLRGRARGRSGRRARPRHLRAASASASSTRSRPQGDAAADGAGDARRLPEGDPEAPLQRRSRAAAAAGRGHRRLGRSPIPPPPGPLEGAAAPRPQGALLRGTPGRRPPARAGPAGAGGDRRREGLPGDDGRRGGRSGPAPRSGSSTGTSRPRKRRSSRPSTAARRRCSAAVLPAFRRAAQLAGVGARRLRGDVRLRRSKSPSTRGSARSRCTRSANARCETRDTVMEGLEALLVPGLRAGARHPADRRRGDRRRDLRADPRPGQAQGAREPARTGADWPPT